jgi:hypothetical protein
MKKDIVLLSVVSIQLSNEDLNKFKKMSTSEREIYIKSNGTVTVTDFSVDYEVPDIEEMNIDKIDKSNIIDYKSKYEKCINVIKRFDAGIIAMYDL